MNTRLLLPLLVGLVGVPVALEGQESEYTRIDTTFSFDRNGRVELGLVSGEIEVQGWNRNEIRIVATLDRGRIDRSFSATRVALSARSVRGRVGAARYQITVPMGTPVSASAVSGEVMIRETKGAVTVQTVSGDILVRESANRATLNSVSGAIRLTDHMGRVSAESVSGTLIIDGVRGEVEAESVSGTVRIRGGAISFLHVETVNGMIAFDGALDPKGLYELSSHSGDLRLTMPATASARLEMQTYSGTLHSDFPVTLAPGEFNASRQKQMRYTLGSGDARVAAQTFSGNINIQRAPARGTEE